MNIFLLSIKDDWQIGGILIGAGTTMLGFALAVGWDIWKVKREKKSLQGNLLNLLSDELEYNAIVVKKGIESMQKELQYLEEKKTIVNALDTPRADFWQVFKHNYDPKFFSSEQITVIKEIYSKIHSIAVNIESRENYRISNGAMSNFDNRMKIYDRLLLDFLAEFECLHHNFKLFKK